MSNKVLLGLLAVMIIATVFVISPKEKPEIDNKESAVAAENKAVEAVNESTSSYSNINLAVAPDIVGTKINGELFELSSFIGNKPVVLDFWTTWCHNCQRSFPVIAKLEEEYGNRIEFLSINLQETAEEVRAFQVKYNTSNIDVLIDSSGKISQDYNIRYTNSHYLINTDGEIVENFSRDLTAKDLELLLDQL